jgi:selenocysteine-specific translation elongation factor
MDSSTTVKDLEPSFRTPPRILIPKLVKSRDKWKAKAGRRKRELKKAQIRSRDLSLSRQRWKERALAAEKQVQDLQQQRDQAQGHLEQARADIAQLQEEGKKNLDLSC